MRWPPPAAGARRPSAASAEGDIAEPALPLKASLTSTDPPPKPSAKRYGIDGAYHVQVGAFMTQAEAENRLGMVQQRAMDLLDGHLPFTASFMKDDKEWYRARFAGFSKAGRAGDLRRAQEAVARLRGDERRVAARRLSVGSSAAEQDFLRLVDPRREIGRAALVGVHLHHQPAMRLPDVLLARAGTDPKHGIGLLGAHAVRAARAAPRPACSADSCVIVAPARQAPIEIGLHQRRFRRAFAMELCQQLHHFARR